MVVIVVVVGQNNNENFDDFIAGMLDVWVALMSLVLSTYIADNNTTLFYVGVRHLFLLLYT